MYSLAALLNAASELIDSVMQCYLLSRTVSRGLNSFACFKDCINFSVSFPSFFSLL